MKWPALLRRLVPAACVAATLAVSAAGVDAQARKPAAKKTETPRGKATQSTSARKDHLQAEQRSLQQRLAALKKQLAAAEASHSDVTDALRASEAAISTANRRLRELGSERKDLERRIADLQDRNRALVARQGEQERQLGLVLRTQFVTSRASPWQRLLDGQDPGQIGRDLRYLEYIGRAKSQLIGELRSRRDELAQLESESRTRQSELAALADEERNNREQLVRQKAAHKRTLDRISKQIATQRGSIAALERNDRRLTSLIDQLTKVLADEARRRQQANARPAPRTRAPAAPAAQPPASSAFAQLRGRLSLPVQGEIVARFGSPHGTEAGVNGPSWKGILIRAPAGTDVHAVAAGRVIFADWLRGFGNLLILDHGEGFLSVYGYNATLLRSVGENVGRGEAIAEVGSSGGNTEPGLYFELRYEGRPMDPLQWAAAR